MSSTDLTEEIEMLKQVLSDKYRNVHFFREGGTRRLYLADWGPGDEKRVIKIDKTPASPRALRHTERGCTTANDIKALAQIHDPEKHYLIRLCDFEVKDGRSISVESFYDSLSLEELVQKQGQLTRNDFEMVFSQVLEGARYLATEAKMLHRDLKPSNILVRKTAESIETRITDFANAARKEELMGKYLPTAGGHLVMDPLLIGEFTGRQSAYNESSEVYALGMDMLYSLLGKQVIEYDPDGKTAKVIATGESLLDRTGRLDRKKHEKVIDDALATLPNGSRRYAPIIKRCLTLDESQRYHSIEDLIKDFKSVNKPSLPTRRFLLAAGAFAGLGALLGLGKMTYDKHKALEAAREEGKKYVVQLGWNGKDLTIDNNLVRLEVFAYADYKKGSYPEKRFLSAMPNEKVSVTVSATDILKSTGSHAIHLDGKIYFEGFEGNNFVVYNSDIEGELFNEDGGSMRSYSGEIKVPDGIREGVFVLATELYVPKEPRFGEEKAFKMLRLPPPGTVIARKRIPVVIGNPKHMISVGSLGMSGVSTPLYFDNLAREDPSIHKPISKDLMYDISIPEYGFREVAKSTGNDWISSLGLPRPKDDKETILQIVVKDGDTPIGYTFFPIKGLKLEKNAYIKEDEYPWYEYSIPTKEFSRKIIEYRKKIDSHNQSR